MRKFGFILSGAIALGLALPAAAQSVSYYVVQNAKTKKCSITTTKPTGTEYTSVGPDGTVYKTRIEAENAMKTVKVCTTD